MKFYKRFPGDITIKTGDLSLVEFGAYDRLLDHYYAKERPIEADRVYTVARCQSPTDRKAVDRVLSEFWTLTSAGWIQERADEMIADALPKIEAAKANGKLGGRPKGSKNKPTGFPEWNQKHPEHETEDETQGVDSEKASQSQMFPLPGETVSKASPSHPPANAGGSGPTTLPCPYEAIVDEYHRLLPTLPAVRVMTDDRKKVIRKFWVWILSSRKLDGSKRASNGSEAMTWIADYFDQASQNDWLMGRTKRAEEHKNWVADIEFLMKEKCLKIVIEKTMEAA